MKPIRQVINVVYDNSNELYDMSITERRIAILLESRIFQKTQIIYFEDDDKLCYIRESVKFHINTKGSVYGRILDTEGFTYLKNKQKVEFWFNKKTLTAESLFIWLTYSKYEWFVDCIKKMRFNIIITPALLTSIINKKITNRTDFIKYFCRYTIKLKSKEIDTVALKNIFFKADTVQSTTRLDIHTLSKIVSISNNKQQMIRKLLSVNDQELGILSDMVNECVILETSINPNWSLKRLKYIHKLQSRQIRDIQANKIEEIIYYNLSDKALNSNFKSKFYNLELITSNKKLFIEGSCMDHCVYNYAYDIQRGNYIVFHNHTNNSTLMVAKRFYNNPDNTWEIIQYYGEENKVLPASDHDIIKQLLQTKDFQDNLDKIKNSTHISTQINNFY